MSGSNEQSKLDQDRFERARAGCAGRRPGHVCPLCARARGAARPTAPTPDDAGMIMLGGFSATPLFPTTTHQRSSASQPSPERKQKENQQEKGQGQTQAKAKAASATGSSDSPRQSDSNFANEDNTAEDPALTSPSAAPPSSPEAQRKQEKDERRAEKKKAAQDMGLPAFMWQAPELEWLYDDSSDEEDDEEEMPYFRYHMNRDGTLRR